MSSPLVQI